MLNIGKVGTLIDEFCMQVWYVAKGVRECVLVDTVSVCVNDEQH